MHSTCKSVQPKGMRSEQQSRLWNWIQLWWDWCGITWCAFQVFPLGLSNNPLKCEFYCHQIGLKRVKNSVRYKNWTGYPRTVGTKTYTWCTVSDSRLSRLFPQAFHQNTTGRESLARRCRRRVIHTLHADPVITKAGAGSELARNHTVSATNGRQEEPRLVAVYPESGITGSVEKWVSALRTSWITMLRGGESREETQTPARSHDTASGRVSASEVKVGRERGSETESAEEWKNEKRRCRKAAGPGRQPSHPLQNAGVPGDLDRNNSKRPIKNH